MLTRATAALRGRDGSGGVHGLGLYSPKALQLRKEEIEGGIRSVMILEGVIANGLRKEAALTHGPVMSAKRREERGNTTLACDLGRRRLGPKRGGERTGRLHGWAGSSVRRRPMGQTEGRRELARGGKGDRAAGPMGQKPRMKWKTFSFSFSSFSKKFQIDFEFIF
jgi:hypothetical protein